MGYIGGLCFPFYWIVWTYWYPQPYESVALRLIGMALSTGLGCSQRWPPAWRARWLVPYAYLTLLYVFPFFFTYMLLRNEASPVWLMSTLVACFLMILLIDWLNLLILLSLGGGLAWLLYLFSEPWPAPPPLHARELWLFVFLLVMGSVFNYRAEILRREKSRAMLLMGAQMAHEMRTPLAGIKIGLSGLQRVLERVLPILQASIQDERRPTSDAGGPGTPANEPDPAISTLQADFEKLSMLKQQIIAQANHAGTIIDMLLLNANRDRATRAGGHNDEWLSIQEIVQTTLRTYPFVSPQERSLIGQDAGFDFPVYGDRNLLICVLYNLFKNALFAIHRRGQGRVRLAHLVGAKTNHLLVRDTGGGIPPAILPHIFDQFFTTKADCDGVGIGLYNTRSIMRAHGGSIRCTSRHGDGTEFDLVFPRHPDEDRPSTVPGVGPFVRTDGCAHRG
jgi:two-component system CAI-1 autoinducer sensor kinase/phosphatase CqsS